MQYWGPPHFLADSRVLSMQVAKHPLAERLAHYLTHRALLPQRYSRCGCECTQQQEELSANDGFLAYWQRSGGKWTGDDEEADVAQAAIRKEQAEIAAAALAAEESVIAGEAIALTEPMRWYLVVPSPEPDFGRLCGTCGKGGLRRLDDVFAVLTSLLRVQQQVQQQQTESERQQAQAQQHGADEQLQEGTQCAQPLALLLDGPMVERLVERANLLLEATAYAKECTTHAMDYDQWCFGLAGALLPRSRRHGWMYQLCSLNLNCVLCYGTTRSCLNGMHRFNKSAVQY